MTELSTTPSNRFYNGIRNTGSRLITSIRSSKTESNNFPTSSVLNGLLFGAAITLTFAAFSSFGKINIYSTIVGHSVLVCAIIMAIINKSGAYVNPTFKSVFIGCFPLLLMLLVPGIMIFLTVNYTKLIKEGLVAANYQSFNRTILFLLFIQLVLLQKQETSLTQLSISILALLQLIIIGFILYVILHYYTTDG